MRVKETGPYSVYFYQEDAGEVPVRDWLIALGKRDWKAFARCVDRIELLEEFGAALRRPISGSLGGDLHELRILVNGVQYRLLYFFYGRGIAVLAHAILKHGDQVPLSDLKRIRERRDRLVASPSKHLCPLDWREAIR